MGAGQKIKCLSCGEVIQSQSVHDFVRCGCGDTFVDGGDHYLRVGGDNWQAMPSEVKYATIQWNYGRTHLYDWAAVRTVCGQYPPEDWTSIDGPVTYHAVSPTRLKTKIDCSTCDLMGTTENLEHCQV